MKIIGLNQEAYQWSEDEIRWTTLIWATDVGPARKPGPEPQFYTCHNQNSYLPLPLDKTKPKPIHKLRLQSIFWNYLELVVVSVKLRPGHALVCDPGRNVTLPTTNSKQFLGIKLMNRFGSSLGIGNRPLQTLWRANFLFEARRFRLDSWAWEKSKYKYTIVFAEAISCWRLFSNVFTQLKPF